MTEGHIHEMTELPPPRMREVSDGVFAYLQPDGSWGLNNAGVLVGREGAVVIDTCFTETRARAFRDAIGGITRLPLRTLVNTHHHGDHTHGNFLFLPEATIVGHELCRARVMETGFGLFPLFPGVRWGEITLAPPSVTFSERLTLFVDDLEVQLIAVAPAHTDNDIVVWLPERRLLFSGDLVFNGGTPFLAQGSVSGSLEALQTLRALQPETIVPGHGDVCGPELLNEMEAYVRFLQETAQRGRAAGLAPLELARGTDLGRFAGWLDPERLVGNLHRAYSELRGEPPASALDLALVISEMISYNGGQPLRCLA